MHDFLRLLKIKDPLYQDKIRLIGATEDVKCVLRTVLTQVEELSHQHFIKFPKSFLLFIKSVFFIITLVYELSRNANSIMFMLNYIP